jgi:hypothetical protein
MGQNFRVGSCRAAMDQGREVAAVWLVTVSASEIPTVCSTRCVHGSAQTISCPADHPHHSARVTPTFAAFAVAIPVRSPSARRIQLNGAELH